MNTACASPRSLGFVLAFTTLAPTVVVGAPPERDAAVESPQVDGETGDGETGDGETGRGETDGGESAESEALSPELTRAKAIYERGVAEYTAGRYERAVELWLEAYTALPANYETSKIRAELIYNIATAQKKAFDIDEDLSHLREAKASLQNFADSIDEAYPEGPERDREREQVERVVAEIDAQIAEVQAARETQARELAALSRPDFDPVLDARLAKQNRTLITAGGVLTGVGVLGLSAMGAGIALASRAERNVGGLATGAELEERRDLMRQGDLGNALAVTGGIVGTVTLITGVSMLSVGLKRERRRKSYRADERDARLRVTPSWSPTAASVTLGGRF